MRISSKVSVFMNTNLEEGGRSGLWPQNASSQSAWEMGGGRTGLPRRR